MAGLYILSIHVGSCSNLSRHTDWPDRREESNIYFRAAYPFLHIVFYEMIFFQILHEYSSLENFWKRHNKVGYW